MLLATACSSTRPSELFVAGDLDPSRVTVTDDIDASRWPSDAISIRSARVVSDSLVVEVEHGGGCREHRYQLLAGSVFAESHPVQTWLRVSHDDGDDVCKALLRRELRSSLAPLRELYQRSYQTGTGEITLHVRGFSARVSYKF